MNRFFITAVAVATFACSQKQEKVADPTVAVTELVTVDAQMVDDSFVAFGSVRPETMATLSAKVAGNVTSVRVHEGDAVRQGDVLLTIDDRDIAAQQAKAAAAAIAAESSAGVARAALAGAEANARLASTTYARYEALRSKNSVSEQEFDEVEGRYRTAIAESERASRALEQANTQRRVAAADVNAASAMLTWTRITAPFDGVITARWVDPGAQAAPGVPLIAVESTQRYRVDASIDEQRATAVHVGDRVDVALRSGGATATGTVTHISPAPDPSSRGYRLQVSLPSNQTLASGASVTLRFANGKRKAIAIPRTAVIDRGELHYVWTVDAGDVIRLRYVATGASSGDRVEVLTGLAAGDRIVVDAHRNLIDGARRQS